MSALDALLEAYDHVVVASSDNLDVDQAHALSQLATSVVVYARDVSAAAALADALESYGLPRAAIAGVDGAPVDQTAA